MKYVTVIVLFVVAIGAALAAAQAAPPKPTPAPELKKLDYFAGNWKSQGELKPSPMGPGGKFTEVTHSQWMPGRFFLVEHTTGEGVMGNLVGVAYLGYNAADKVYTYDAFNNQGEAEHARGTVEGDTWTWTSTEKMGAQTMKARFTITVASSTSYSFKFEMAPEGGSDYSTVVEGKATKVGAATPASTTGKKK